MIIKVIDNNNKVIREESIFENDNYLLTDILNAKPSQDIHGFLITEEVIENLKKESKYREKLIMSDRSQLLITEQFIEYLVNITNQYNGTGVHVQNTYK